MKIWMMCAITLTATPSLAGTSGPDEQGALCYETIGCVQDRAIDQSQAEKLGCDQLWTARNGIYHARGYCFKTDRGRQEFGNEKLIRSIEQRRGC